MFPDVESATELYASRFAGPVGRWFLEVQAQHLERAIRRCGFSREGEFSLLDIGGGHGQVVAAILERFPKARITVTGSLANCFDRLPGDLRVQRMTATLTSLPFGERSFDVVTSFRILPHLPEWERLLEEATRIAARGIVIDYPRLWSMNAVAPLLFSVKRAVEQGTTRPFALFSDREIAHALDAGGFSTVYRRGQFIAPMALYRALRHPLPGRILEGMWGLTGLTRLFGSPVIIGAIRQERKNGRS